MLILMIAATIILFGLVLLYRKIRKRIPIKVNCWFCNKWQTVEYYLKNGYKCQACEQYNGFNSNGDYNIILPGQYDLLMNDSKWAKSMKSKPSSSRKFCYKCSEYQRLKIQQTADFVPQNEDNFDEEIYSFKMRLEAAYKLCDACETVLKEELENQNQWILSQHMDFIKTKTAQSSMIKLSIWNYCRKLLCDRWFWLLITSVLIFNEIMPEDFLRKYTSIRLARGALKIRHFFESKAVAMRLIGSAILADGLLLSVKWFLNDNDKFNTTKKLLQIFLWSLLMVCEFVKNDFYHLCIILKIAIIWTLSRLIFQKPNKISRKNVISKPSQVATAMKAEDSQRSFNASTIKETELNNSANKQVHQPDDLSEKFCDLNLRNLTNNESSQIMCSRSSCLRPSYYNSSSGGFVDNWAALSRSSSQSSGFSSYYSFGQNRSFYQFPIRRPPYNGSIIKVRQYSSVI